MCHPARHSSSNALCQQDRTRAVTEVCCCCCCFLPNPVCLWLEATLSVMQQPLTTHMTVSNHSNVVAHCKTATCSKSMLLLYTLSAKPYVITPIVESSPPCEHVCNIAAAVRCCCRHHMYRIPSLLLALRLCHRISLRFCPRLPLRDCSLPNAGLTAPYTLAYLC